MFRVMWLRPALNELTDLWLSGDSVARRAVAEAAHAIDRELQDNPFRSSESRDDDTRVLFVFPLGVQIEIDLESRIAWVMHVWRFRRRGK